MPPEWSPKDKRQYKHIRQRAVGDGKSKQQATEIAARTVNKQRREEGRTPNKTSQGTGNPHTRLEERTVEELRNRARELEIDGRSKLNKAGLVSAIRDRMH